MFSVPAMRNIFPKLTRDVLPLTTAVSKRQKSNKEVIALSDKYGAHHYHPIPVALSKGNGVFLWDVEGKRYYDYLSGYSASNLGHCHPRLIKALTKQAGILHHCSRAFYVEKLAEFQEYITEFTGYEKVSKILLSGISKSKFVKKQDA